MFSILTHVFLLKTTCVRRVKLIKKNIYILEENVLEDSLDTTYKNIINLFRELNSKTISLYPIPISLLKDANLSFVDISNKNYNQIIDLIYKLNQFKWIIKNIKNNTEKTHYIIDDVNKNYKTITLKHLLKNYIYEKQINDKL